MGNLVSLLSYHCEKQTAGSCEYVHCCLL